MLTMEITITNERITQIIEEINTMENHLIKNTLVLSLEEAKGIAGTYYDIGMECEELSYLDDEALFYARLLRAKCEEIFDIIEMKQA